MGACLAREVSGLQCANGIISKGARVQTQYTRDEGGDDLWYTASVTACYENGTTRLAYDDGDSWTGPAVYVYMLPPGAPGHFAPQPYGAPGQGQATLPPAGGVVMATPVASAAPTVVGAPVPIGQAMF